MSVTPERLLQASQLAPDMLGADAVDPDATAEEQKQAALDWLRDNVLPLADAEVAVPLLEATGYDTVADFVNGRFPDSSNIAQATRDKWIAKGESLYDAAVLSYARSEVNKSIASSAEEYDRDSDQDRIQGNQRLEKLLTWARTLIATGGMPGEDEGVAAGTGHRPVSVRQRPVFI